MSKRLNKIVSFFLSLVFMASVSVFEIPIEAYAIDVLTLSAVTDQTTYSASATSVVVDVYLSKGIDAINSSGINAYSYKLNYDSAIFNAPTFSADKAEYKGVGNHGTLTCDTSDEGVITVEGEDITGDSPLVDSSAVLVDDDDQINLGTLTFTFKTAPATASPYNFTFETAEAATHFDFVSGGKKAYFGATDSLALAGTSITFAADTVAAPTASVAAGAVGKGATVTLSSATDGATIYYTTDGTEPTVNSTAYSSAITISSAMTIKAIAAKTGLTTSSVSSYAYTIATHTVTYSANGATEGTVPTDSVNYESGSEATVLDNTGGLLQTVETETNSFVCWNTSSDGTGDSYYSGDKISISSDVTLYAQFSSTMPMLGASAPFTVSYDANGATGGTAPTDATAYASNASATVLDNTGSLAKTGYTFSGWSTSSTATEASYIAGSTITMTDNVTLYAVWIPFTYTSEGAQITITGFTGTDTVVTVPATVATLPVKVIGDNAFKDKTTITSVALPNGIITVGKYAFQGCSALTSVNIPSSVTSLGEGAFYLCTKLPSIVVPSSVTSLGAGAFSNCTALTSVNIPSSVTAINMYTFDKCTSLTSITIPSSVTVLGEGVFRDCSALKSIDIPSGVTNIPKVVFQHCAALTSVNIPYGVTFIDDTAFVLCYSLTRVTIPSSVTYIGRYAFSGDSKLTTAIFKGNAPVFGLNVFYNVASDFKILYYKSKELGTVNWSTPTWSGYAAYPLNVVYDANGGTEDVPIDNTIYSNGDTVTVSFSPLPTRTGYTFEGWATSESATSAEYSSSGVTTFTKGAEDVTLYAVWTLLPTYAVSYNANGGTGGTAPTDSTAYAFNASATVLDNTGSLVKTGYTFSGWSTTSTSTEASYIAGSTITMTDNVTLFAVWVPFTYTSDGTQITITGFTGTETVVTVPATVAILPVKVIGDNAFKDKTTITSVALPNGIITVGKYAFQGCSALTSVNIPSSVTSLGEGAFYLCTKLPSIVVPSSVTSLGAGAFSNCTALTSVNIPSSVTAINMYTFDNCTSLASITIPSSVTILGEGVFRLCTALTSIDIPSGVTSIPKVGFQNCYALKSANIQSGVTSISDRAFYLCTALTSINIPSSVVSIGDSVFYGCNALKNANIPSSVTSLGGGAFTNCTVLESITIPSSVISIGAITFANCKALKSITIPSSVTSIGFQAFSGDSNLATAMFEGNAPTIFYNKVFDGTASGFKILYYSSKTLGEVNWSTPTWNGYAAYPLCTVTYDANGGTGRVPIDSAIYSNGDTVTVSFGPTPTRTGYTFAGWATTAGATSAAYTSSGTTTFAMGSAPVTLYAVWTALPTYAVAYNSNGSTSGAVPTDIASPYLAGANVTVLGNTGTLARPGYTFAGWNTAADGSGTPYAAGATFAMGTAPATLYAAWTALPTYAVTYNANGATSGSVPTDSASPYLDGATVTVLGNTGSLARTGYTFAGWNTAADGSGTPYAAGATFTIGAAPVTLYAQWALLKMTYNANGATGGTAPVDSTGYSYGASATVFDNTGSLVKTGYTFSGWSTSSTATEATYIAGRTITVTDNVTLYAVWIPFTYTSDGTQITITGYIGTDTVVTVPATVATLPVKVIGNNAFQGKWAITSISLPNDIISIGAYAFNNCRALQSVNIPSGVTAINEYTFADCHSLSSITIPSGVTFLGDYAFSSCPSLKSIDIPSGVTNINGGTFLGCTSLTSLTIPSGVTSIGNYAIQYCTSLTSITIPASVTSIGIHAFSWDGNLSTVMFEGNAPTTFGDSVFYNTAANFKILYYYSKTVGTVNWNTPTWNGYTAYPLCPVTYDANGGTGSVPTDSALYSNGDTVTVSSNPGPTRVGYTFAGWNTAADGSGTPYAAGATFAMGTAPVTLYAAWTALIPSLTFTGASGFWQTTFTDGGTTYDLIRYGNNTFLTANDFVTAMNITNGYVEVYDKSGNLLRSTKSGSTATSSTVVVSTGGTIRLCDSYDAVVKTYGLVMKGDINGDGFTLGNDVIFIKRIVAGTYSASTYEKAAADTTGDGFILGTDAILLKRYIAVPSTATVDQTK